MTDNWPEFMKKHFATVRFFQFMDATVIETSHGYAKISIPMKPQYANTYGITHGGIIAALVDMAAGIALRTLKYRILTVETTANYFAPVPLHENLLAEARLLQQGGKLLHADIDIYNSQNILVGRGKAIYYLT